MREGGGWRKVLLREVELDSLKWNDNEIMRLMIQSNTPGTNEVIVKDTQRRLEDPQTRLVT